MGGRKSFMGYGTSFDSDRNGNWFSWDICGILGISVSYSIHIYALVILALFVIPNSWFMVLLYVGLYLPCSLLALSSLFQAQMSNPGAVPMGAKPFTIVRLSISSMSSTASATSASGAGTSASSGSGVLSSAPSSGNSNGSVTNNSKHRKRSIRRCHKCNDNYKPNRAHHDSVTGRCIVKFDHFCPWVNNAIGATNHKFFCLFLLYTFLCCLLSLLLLIVRLIRCGFVHDDDAMQYGSGDKSDSMNSNTGTFTDGGGFGGGGANNGDARSTEGDDGDGDDVRLLFFRVLLESYNNKYVYPECTRFAGNHLITILAIVSLVFLVFTAAMGCEQLEAISTGQGKIARMKQSVGQAGTELQRVTTEFNEMFGGNSPNVEWHWFLPIPVQFPRGMKQIVLGYEFNDTCLPVPYQDPHVDDDDGDNIDGTSSARLDAAEKGIPKPPPPPSQKLIAQFRESSEGASSSVSRRSRLSSDDGATAEEGITLVERTKARLA